VRNNVVIYRPPSRWPVVIAFAAAIMIHLCAVVLASRRAPPSAEVSSAGTSPSIEIEYPNTPPLPPEVDTMPEPPTVSAPTDFVEPNPSPAHSLIRNPTPIRPLAKARLSPTSNGLASAVNAPRPGYPYEARRRNITGRGVVALMVDEATGAVIGAEMEQSIGSPILDQAALSALRRWRFKNGTPVRVRVPITFTMTGAHF
jgi:periplasmic protein TonB